MVQVGSANVSQAHCFSEPKVETCVTCIQPASADASMLCRLDTQERRLEAHMTVLPGAIHSLFCEAWHMATMAKKSMKLLGPR